MMISAVALILLTTIESNVHPDVHFNKAGRQPRVEKKCKNTIFSNSERGKGDVHIAHLVAQNANILIHVGQYLLKT